ncbi:MAG TPA: hypothetical protein VHL10_00220, partial [Nitrososphaera sp.]|nr:hypothetical protein [Nitrososphaera sp.]
MASANTEVNIPTTFDYNERDVQTNGFEPRPPKAQLLPETMYKVAVTAAGRTVASKDFGDQPATNNLQLRLTFAPVDANDRPQLVEVSKFIDIPVPNPEIEGHEVAATVYVDGKPELVTGKRARRELFKKAKRVIQALDPTAIPSFGFRPDDDGHWRDADGEVATQEQMDAATEKQNEAILATLKKWYTDLSTVMGATSYLMTASRKGDKVYPKYFT